MGYIGSVPATNFETVRKQVSTTNSGTTITLDYAVSSVQDILVTVNAVVQSYDNYSVSGTTLTLGGTLNNDRVEILYVGRTFQTVSPATASVTNDMLSGSIANSKLANSSITLNGSAVSLGGSTSLVNTPIFSVSRTTDQTGVSDNTETKVQFNNVIFDSHSGWDSSNYWWVVPTDQSGKYFISFKVRCSSGGTATQDDVAIYLYGGSGTNGIDLVQFSSINHNYDYITFGHSGIYELNAGNRINVYVQIDNDGGTSQIDGNSTWNYTNLQIAKVIE